MSLTPSSMIPLGTIAPDFTLPDAVSGKMLSLQSLKSKVGTVIMFICNHCPFVQHIQKELVRVATEYTAKEIQFIAINSNDETNYPEDAPPEMKKVAEAFGYPFPFLFDADQTVAKAYHAACTPDFFVFDQALKCVYRGRFDETTPGKQIPITGKDLCAALDALIAGKPIDSHQFASVGCNIKWKKSEAN